MLHAFYVPNFLLSRPVLSDEEGFHAQKALRIRVDEELLVLDGRGNRYRCRLLSKESPYLLSVEESKFFAPSLELQILVSPPKRSTRLEWLVEKCGELGVRRLSFVQTKRTQRVSISVPRLQRIAISSLKQSQQSYLLQIDEIEPFTIALSVCRATTRFVADTTCSFSEKKNRLPYLQREQSSCALLIGPEGGLTSDELQESKAASFTPFSMGRHTLRSETGSTGSSCTVSL